MFLFRSFLFLSFFYTTPLFYVLFFEFRLNLNFGCFNKLEKVSFCSYQVDIEELFFYALVLRWLINFNFNRDIETWLNSASLKCAEPQPELRI